MTKNVQETGRLQTLHPLVHRLLAPNPSPFTYSGTQTYLVGSADIAIVDPGPNLPDHIDAIMRAIDGRPIRGIVCTHTHKDHSPAAGPLKALTGAPIIGCAPLVLSEDGPRADAGFDPSYQPDQVLGEGECLTGEGWTLRAIHTPGHTSNHICYALEEANGLFTGDHVMGWSTSVVVPPDGNMAHYLESLDRLVQREQDEVYYPAHGEPIERPQRFVRGLIGHRKQREGQILRLLKENEQAITSMVERMYVGIDPQLHFAAGLSVFAHLVDLETRGLVLRHDMLWRLAA